MSVHMTAEWSVPAWAVLATLGVLVVVLGAMLVIVRRSAARAALALATARSASDELRAQVDAIEQQVSVSRPRRDAEPDTGRDQSAGQLHEYVITRLGDERDRLESDAVPAIEAPLFADLVLRESLVQAASLVAGVRRALAPEHLNRVRFEMRREVKRARKERRATLRQARRDYEARQRAGERAGEAVA